MIPRSVDDGQGPDWRGELRRGLGSLAEVAAWGGLPPATASAEAAARQFPVRIPPAFAERIERPDGDDPLLCQVLPSAAELEPHPGFVADPVGDRDAVAAPGMLQKYRGRALLMVTGACAIHCRYCFRRHFPYGEQTLTRKNLAAILDHIRRDPSLSEVILSGGDPLMLADERLAPLIEGLGAIPQLARLRLHTRMATALPARITPALTRLLAGSRLIPVVVTHVNHPQELGPAAIAALERLRRAGIRLLNQSVLLRGVNDDAAVLARLSDRLFAAGVLPYYLHLLDPVAGAAHFDVDEARAVAIVRELRAQVAGYLVPRLVRERPGAPAKEPVQV